jgi:hypothetical protein
MQCSRIAQSLDRVTCGTSARQSTRANPGFGRWPVACDRAIDIQPFALKILEKLRFNLSGDVGAKRSPSEQKYARSCKGGQRSIREAKGARANVDMVILHQQGLFVALYHEAL